MGKLLRFVLRTKPVSDGAVPDGNAQILMFTGVRYERGTPPPPKSVEDAKRRKRKGG